MPGYGTRLSDPEVGRIPSVTLGHDRISWRSFRPNPLGEVTPLLLFLSAREWNCFANSVADVAHGVNERRLTNFLAQPSNKNFH